MIFSEKKFRKKFNTFKKLARYQNKNEQDVELTKTLSFKLFFFWRFCSLGSYHPWRVVEVTLGYRTFEQRHSNVVLPF